MSARSWESSSQTLRCSRGTSSGRVTPPRPRSRSNSCARLPRRGPRSPTRSRTYSAPSAGAIDRTGPTRT
eukprot:10393439-Alexandrium_andersonii.AAC.1